MTTVKKKHSENYRQSFSFKKFKANIDDTYESF